MRTILLAWLAIGVAGVWAADWPSFAHDNQRTRVSAEQLAPPLQLRWVFRAAAAPAKGWSLPVNGYGARKNKSNASYDDAYRVIAVGGTAYFSCSADNQVYAVDMKSGDILWTFVTGAAPRLAPAFSKGKLYVGADDGKIWNRIGIIDSNPMLVRDR